MHLHFITHAKSLKTTSVILPAKLKRNSNPIFTSDLEIGFLASNGSSGHLLNSRNRSCSFLRVVQDTSRVKVAKGKMPFRNSQWDKKRTSGTPVGLTIRYSFWNRFGFFSRNGARDTEKHFAFQLITKDFDV